MCNANVHYSSRNSLSLDEIVDSEGSGNKNEHTACEVGNGAVNGKTDTYSEGSDEGGDCACVNSEVADKCNYYDALEDELGGIQKSFGDRLVEVLLLARLAYLLREEVDKLEGNEEKNESDNDLNARSGSPAYKGVKKIFQNLFLSYSIVNTL